MNSQKEIEEVLEIDKCTQELVEGYASCLFSEGEEIGKIKGEARAWQKIMSDLMPILEVLPKEDKLNPLATTIVKNYMDSVDRSNKVYKTWKPDKESKALKQAFWNVLKKRLKF